MLLLILVVCATASRDLESKEQLGTAHAVKPSLCRQGIPGIPVEMIAQQCKRCRDGDEVILEFHPSGVAISGDCRATPDLKKWLRTQHKEVQQWQSQVVAQQDLEKKEKWTSELEDLAKRLGSMADPELTWLPMKGEHMKCTCQSLDELTSLCESQPVPLFGNNEYLNHLQMVYHNLTHYSSITEAEKLHCKTLPNISAGVERL